MAIRLSLQEDAIEETHEINVTPFIDVILVLLIIVMVAAPLSTVDMKSNLSLALGEAAVSRDNLAGALDAATGADKEQRIFVRADRTVALEAGPEGGSPTPGEPARSASEIKPVAQKPTETSPVGLKP